jgi:PIN domain nuclease of toxin-antitoxin system
MILLDTQVVVWLAFEPGLLSSAALEAIGAARARNGVAISDKTLWEIAMMVWKGKVDIQGSLIDFLRTAEREFLVLPIDAAVAERSMTFSANFPKDPADRIIAATALVYGLALVTADKGMRRSGEVACIW